MHLQLEEGFNNEFSPKGDEATERHPTDKRIDGHLCSSNGGIVKHELMRELNLETGPGINTVIFCILNSKAVRIQHAGT